VGYDELIFIGTIEQARVPSAEQTAEKVGKADPSSA
jgi:hypothetical protein